MYTELNKLFIPKIMVNLSESIWELLNLLYNETFRILEFQKSHNIQLVK